MWLVVAGYLTSTDRPLPDLAVLTSPAMDSTLPRWKLSLAGVLGKVTPTLEIANGIDPSTLSWDPSVGKRAAADPVTATKTTVRFGAEASAEQDRVRSTCVLISVPMLVLHGLDDGLVPASSSEFFAAVPGVERRTYPGLRHELHNEREGQQIIDDVIAWLREHATVEA